MHMRHIYRFVVYMLLAATLAACGSPLALGLPLSASMQQQGSAAAPSASGSGDLCTNSLVPIKPGAEWDYSNTGVASNPVTFSTTIRDVHSDHFTVLTHFDEGASVEQDWQCTPDGLVAMTFGSGQTTLGLSMDNIVASILTTDVAGTTLPSNIQQGKSWMYAFKITGNVLHDNVMMGVNGNIATTFQAVGTETVTVPAGTFNAMKIAASTKMEIHANYSGIDMPISSALDGNFWFAPGVGWIKSTQTGSLPGMSVDSTTELQSYKIP
jgi:hypothetical protein